MEPTGLRHGSHGVGQGGFPFIRQETRAEANTKVEINKQTDKYTNANPKTTIKIKAKTKGKTQDKEYEDKDTYKYEDKVKT